MEKNINWLDDAMISVRIDAGEALISANREGLLSLADHLTALAEEMPGVHIHYDEYNSLKEGSCELIIEKKDFGSEEDR